jgi:hypothetical protein
MSVTCKQLRRDSRVVTEAKGEGEVLMKVSISRAVATDCQCHSHQSEAIQIQVQEIVGGFLLRNVIQHGNQYVIDDIIDKGPILYVDGDKKEWRLDAEIKFKFVGRKGQK